MRGPIPKYFVVKAILEARLERDYAPGARVPSEAELCRDFRVSRITIQQALGWLEKEGTLRREQGRGTFYLGRAANRTETKPSELLESLVKYRDGAFARVVASREVRATPRVAERLGLLPDDRVIAIDRLAFVDGLPIVFIQAYLCLALGRKLLADAPLLERNTIASLLKDRHGVAVDSVVQTIGASLADPSFAHHLGLEVGAPVLEGERTYYDPGGRPILVSLAFYRADRHRFAVTLKQWR